MTDIRKRPNIYATAGTLCVWILIFALLSIVSILPHRQEYKTVRITLESPSATRPETSPSQKPEPLPPPLQEKAPAPAQSAAPAASASTPSSASSPKPASQPKSSAPKTATPAPEPARQTLQKSVEELMAEQMASRRPEKKEFDWSAFEDEAVETSSSSVADRQSYGNAQSVETFQGTAGTLSSGQSDGALSSSSADGRASGQSVSGSTAAALGGIAATVYSASSGNGVTSSSSVMTGSSPDGKLSLYMSDGSSRTLIEPEEPVIALSDSAALTIDTTKNLSVRFTVLANGHVDLSSITVSPASIISPLVQSEIARAVASWRFSEDSASASAVFPYRIEKR